MCRFYVKVKAVALHDFAVGSIVIVLPALTDADEFGMACQRHDCVDRSEGLVRGVHRVSSDGVKHMYNLLRDGADSRFMSQPGGNRHHPGDAKSTARAANSGSRSANSSKSSWQTLSEVLMGSGILPPTGGQRRRHVIDPENYIKDEHCRVKVDRFSVPSARYTGNMLVFFVVSRRAFLEKI